MARVLFGGGVVSVKGSVKGTTFSGGLAGAVMKGKAYSISGGRVLQRKARAVMARTVGVWQTLTPTVQAQWDLYAASVPFTNSLGVVYYLTGFQMFVRSYAWNQGGGAVLSTTVPTLSGLPVLPTLTISYDGPTDLITIDAVTPALDPDAELKGAIYMCARSYSLNPLPRVLSNWVMSGTATLPYSIAAGVSTLVGPGRDCRFQIQWRGRDSANRITNRQYQFLDFTSAP